MWYKQNEKVVGSERNGRRKAQEECLNDADPSRSIFTSLFPPQGGMGKAGSVEAGNTLFG